MVGCWRLVGNTGRLPQAAIGGPVGMDLHCSFSYRFCAPLKVTIAPEVSKYQCLFTASIFAPHCSAASKTAPTHTPGTGAAADAPRSAGHVC